MADPTPDPANDGAPADPFGSLAATAMSVHELHAAYVAAGFTRAEALQIIIALVRPSG